MTGCVGKLGYFLLFAAAFCDAAKVLILPAPIYSHCLELSAIGQELADRGHNVSIFLDWNFISNHCYNKFVRNETLRIKPIMFRSNPDAKGNTLGNTSYLLENEEFDAISNILIEGTFVRLNCQALLSDRDAVLGLQEEHFDIVVADGSFLNYCIFVIPYKLGVPNVAAGSLFDDFITGRPFLPSTVPSVLSKFTDDMSFAQKLKNMLYALAVYQIGYWTMPMDIIATIAPELTTNDILNLASKSELFLYNSGTVLGYPFPVMPNHVYIGGITTSPARSLIGRFKDFYSESKTGVVLVTFGGSLSELPKRVETNLLQALKRIDEDVLWKYLPEGRHENVLQVKWVPQNDALGDPKTKLFISHCGNNGMYEALYHGVPVLCTPVMADQHFNAMRVQSWNVGAYVNLMKSTEDELYAAIQEVLNNPMYRHNMKKASQMYHSQPMKARELAAFWVEYVMKFGSKHLKSRGSEMPAFSFLAYDVLLFVLSIIFTIILTAVKCLSFCCRKLTKATKLKTS